jgi:inorganic pyrophosphatase
MTATSSQSAVFEKLAAFDAKSQHLQVIIETPRGSRNKYKYDEQHGLFALSKVLPAGSVFPFDFGYIPSTLAEDGDPLDVLLLMEEEAFVGCMVPARLIGVIEAEQTEKDKTERNDRLIAIAAASHHYRTIQTLDQLNEEIVKEIEHFFVSYNSLAGKQFKPIGRFDAERAKQLVQQGMDRFQQKQAS